jgi:formylglycine-generating enzyme required for sulfatase activity
MCVVDLESNAPQYFCPSCGAKLFNLHVTAGYVYILSNPSMPGLLKIGCTERGVEERIAELSSTGVPTPFEIEAIFESADPRQDEQQVHEVFRNHRLANNREFFVMELKPAVRQTISSLGISPCYLKTPSVVESELERRAAKNKDGLWTSIWSTIDFVPIPAGNFLMGADNGDAWEKPVHRVKISKPFWMAKTPITLRQYARVMGENSASSSCILDSSVYAACGESKQVARSKYFSNPVVWLSSFDAEEFCKKLTQLEHKEGDLPDDCEYILPTEAQWEYACRAGTQGDYYGDLNSVGWYVANSGGQTHPVGQKEPNAWGLYDMHGNVWEWCRDRLFFGEGKICNFKTDTYYPDALNPVCERGPHRVVRGGGWSASAYQCRSAWRGNASNDNSTTYIGFRIVVQQK